MLYIRLFHGRVDPMQEMNDWGSDGPILGPYQFVHTTYNCYLRLGKSDGSCDELIIAEEDMIYYDGVYYGDWSVFGQEELEADKFEISVYDPSKSKHPKTRSNKARLIVYIKGGVCQNIKTNIPEGLWESEIVDFDNNPDLPDDYVPFSDDEMRSFP